MKIRFCPKCGSEEVMMPRGDALLWKCKRCGFLANIFPEKMNKQKRNLKKITKK